MLTLPKMTTRDAQPYAALRETMRMDGINAFAARAFPLIEDWVAQKHIAAGPAFLKYNIIDMAGELEIECGVPLTMPVEPEGEVISDTLPAGKFVELTYRGHFDDLESVTAMLIGWAKQKDFTWDVREEDDGDHFACRLEIYRVGPGDTQDPSAWETDLVFKLAD